MFFFFKFQHLMEKIHHTALLMFVLSSSWVVCIRGPEDTSGQRQWEVPMRQCVCVGLLQSRPLLKRLYSMQN